MAVLAAGAAAIVRYTVPGMIPALERNPDRLADGQWWRLVTPPLVQTLGWHQVLANLMTLAVIGAVAERLFSAGRWVLLMVAGTAG